MAADEDDKEEEEDASDALCADELGHCDSSCICAGELHREVRIDWSEQK